MQQDILRLDVTVDHVVPVGVVESAGHLGGDAHCVGNGELLLAGEPVAQRFSLHKRHDVVEERLGQTVRRPVGPSVRHATIKQGQDMRVLQVGRGLDLGEEPLRADDGGELRAKDLDRHLAIVLEVVGQVDGGHPPLPQLPLEPVAVGEGGLEALRNGRHRVRRHRTRTACAHSGFAGLPITSR